MIRTLSAIAAALLGVAALAAEPAPSRPDAPLYRLDRYTAKPGKLDGLHDWFRANADELFGKSAGEAVAFLVPATATAENAGKLLVISRYRNEDALRAVAEGLARHPRCKPLDPTSTADDALVASVDAVIGVPTDYSPQFTPRKATIPRVFELRSYTSPSPEKLARLHDRFRDHTMKLFAKHGMENLVYWRPQGGGDCGRQLVYLLGHTSQDAARESFAAFRQDPDWLAAKKASEDKAGGSLTSPENGVISEFFVPTDYTPLR
jgi:hypothetical protein